MLNRTQALELLDWAEAQNPGKWKAHSLHVARAAETLARHCGMDAERAWVLGALHDIGRYAGVRDLHHTIAGYRLLTERGDPDAARVCLTHSFPDGVVAHYSGGMDVTDEERAQIEDFIERHEMDDWDRLIQLCDALCTAEGACLIEKRLVDVALRYGVRTGVEQKRRAFMDLRARFEERMGRNVYSLFPEAVENTFDGNGKKLTYN